MIVKLAARGADGPDLAGALLLTSIPWLAWVVLLARSPDDPKIGFAAIAWVFARRQNPETEPGDAADTRWHRPRTSAKTETP